MQFSTNLGVLWTAHSFPVAFRAAKLSGIAAVECDHPYDTPAIQVRQALIETGLGWIE